ncbi:MAG TPA: metallophosphoesterase [Haliangiales bacterium]|nr:metallophosphoesterase [Haliangiales bacterium]
MRLAHLTDLHLLSLDGARLRDFANKRWTGGMNLLLRRGRHHQPRVFEAMVTDLNERGVEQIACTGDVTNLSLAAEFRFARGYFDRIAAGPANVFCVPGNHDTYVAEADGRFEEVFGDYCASDPEWRWDNGSPWPAVRIRGDLALVGLCTGRPSGWLTAHGVVGAEQLARAEQVLTDARLRGKLRVVVMHHPSAGPRARSRLRGLQDHEAFAAMIARAGADLVLHGHEHLDLAETLAGPGGRSVPVRCMTSATYADATARRRARYRIYTIVNGDGGPRLAAEEVRAFRPDRGTFETEVGPS